MIASHKRPATDITDDTTDGNDECRMTNDAKANIGRRFAKTFSGGPLRWTRRPRRALAYEQSGEGAASTSSAHVIESVPLKLVFRIILSAVAARESEDPTS